MPSGTWIKIPDKNRAKVHAGIKDLIANYPTLNKFYVAYEIIKAIHATGPGLRVCPIWSVSSVPSQCGMLNINATYAQVDAYQILAQLNNAIGRLEYSRTYDAIPEDYPLLDRAVTDLRALLPFAKEIVQPTYGYDVPDSTLELLAKTMEKDIIAYSGMRQFILTDNVLFAECFFAQNRGNKVPLHPCHLVKYFSGVVIHGPLSCNYNHPNNGYIQTFIWIPESRGIVQLDKDPTYGVRIQVSGEPKVETVENVYDARTYLDSQVGSKLTLLKEDKEVLDSEKKEKFPEITKSRKVKAA